uniref:Ragulator complex protein LAMTOR1 n=1 Tax=Crocodylus porosus TaxID=8502 RepID=A0A7M4FKG5_CROPO
LSPADHVPGKWQAGHVPGSGAVGLGGVAASSPSSTFTYPVSSLPLVVGAKAHVTGAAGPSRTAPPAPAPASRPGLARPWGAATAARTRPPTSNIIDVSAADSQGMEQHEYMDRARQYSTRLAMLSNNLTHWKKLPPLPSLTSQPHQVLASEPVPFADLQQVRSSLDQRAGVL